MAKKKIVKKLTVTSSFFTMHKHARWLLVIFLLDTLFFLAVSHNSQKQQDAEFNRVFGQATADAHSFTK